MIPTTTPNVLLHYLVKCFATFGFTMANDQIFWRHDIYLVQRIVAWVGGHCECSPVRPQLLITVYSVDGLRRRRRWQRWSGWWEGSWPTSDNQ